MDIRKWSLERIMTLPDHCFGRRWPIFCEPNTNVATRVWDISELAFPEKCVIWQVNIQNTGAFVANISYRLALGNRLPTTMAQMSELEPLLPGLGLQGIEPRIIGISQYSSFIKIDMRNPLNARGRRLVVEYGNVAAGDRGIIVCVVVSSMPEFVPDHYTEEFWGLCQETWRRR